MVSIDPGKVTKPSNVVPFSRRIVGEFSITIYNQCRDGYLIVKPGKGDRPPFLGCTNYKHDGTGCSGFMTMDYYLRNTDARFEELKEELK